MTDSFLDNAGGYTPVPDKLVREYDFTTAYVWGKVWRYCQMANGACTASHETIANRAGMSRRTLIEKLNVLIKDGYIEDKTPDLKNKPHTYCTKIGEAKITSTMQISHTESDMPMEPDKDLDLGSDMSMRIMHSDDVDIAQPDSPTMQNLHTEDAGIAQPAESTMQNLHLKRVVVLHDEIPGGYKPLPTFEILYNRWLDNLGELKPRQVDLFGDYYDEHPEWVADIIDTTIGGKPDNPWQYFVRIINSWVKDGKPAQPPPKREGRQRASPNGTHPPNKSSPPLSAEKQEALRQLQVQDAKEIHIPGS